MGFQQTSRLLISSSERLRSLREARTLYNVRAALDFNIIQIMSPREIMLSRLLGSFLDPHGPHGQGLVFLREFLALHGIGDWVENDCSIKVTLEKVILDRRRIDILIECNDRAVAIENKPWAVDQYRQAESYLSFLNRYSQSKLIYLSGYSGYSPSEDSIGDFVEDTSTNDRRLIPSSWSALVPWIDRCRSRCEAERVRSALDDIERYISSTFIGISDMTEQQSIESLILDSESNIESAIHLSNIWIATQDRLAESLKYEILEKLGEGWTTDGFLRRTKSTLRFFSRSRDEIKFSIGFDSKNYTNFYYGIEVARDPTFESVLTHRLTREFGPPSENAPMDGWPWWRHPTEADSLGIGCDWNGDPRPWVEIKSGELAAKLANLAETMVEFCSRVPKG